MKKKILAIMLGTTMAIGSFTGCGAKEETAAPETTKATTDATATEAEDVTFDAFLEYAEDVDDTIQLTIGLLGLYGTIYEDMTPSQITFDGDLKEATNVEVFPSDEGDVEVSLTIPKGDLTAENWNLMQPLP